MAALRPSARKGSTLPQRRVNPTHRVGHRKTHPRDDSDVAPSDSDGAPPDTHVSSVAFEAPFDVVWDVCADPLRFPELYPNRIAEIEQTGDGEYRAVTPDGDAFTLLPSLSYANGIIDYTVVLPDGATEAQRSRLFPLDDHSCMLVHLDVRFDGLSDADWVDHRESVYDDLEHASRVVGEQHRTETAAE